jgi:PKD repeat protein
LVFSLAIGEGTRYYYARAVQADGDQSVTAPVWTESPLTGLQAENDGPTALGQPTTFTATIASGSSERYAWDLGDGTHGSGSSLVHTYPAVGTYTAVVTASNHVSLLTATTTVVVEDTITPTAAFTATSPVCHGQAAWFYFTGDPGMPAADQYTWWFGDGMGMTVGTPDPVMHLYTPGTYTATLEVCNQTACDMAEEMVQVEPLPVAGFTYAVDELTATFTDTAMYATSWLWDLGDGITATVRHPVHTYAMAGMYTVTQYAHNDCGADLAAHPVTVGVAPTAAFTHNAPVCLGAVVTFTNETTGTAPIWPMWDWGDGGTSTETNPVYLYAAAGLYTVTLDATNDFGADQAMDGVEVLELPLAAFSYTLNGLEAIFFNLSEGADGYLWDLGDGVGTSTETHPVYTYAGAGTYTVTLEITGPCGEDSTETAITVEARGYLIYLPLVWRPAGK